MPELLDFTADSCSSPRPTRRSDGQLRGLRAEHPVHDERRPRPGRQPLSGSRRNRSNASCWPANVTLPLGTNPSRREGHRPRVLGSGGVIDDLTFEPLQPCFGQPAAYSAPPIPRRDGDTTEVPATRSGASAGTTADATHRAWPNPTTAPSASATMKRRAGSARTSAKRVCRSSTVPPASLAMIEAVAGRSSAVASRTLTSSRTDENAYEED